MPINESLEYYKKMQAKENELQSFPSKQNN